MSEPASIAEPDPAGDARAVWRSMARFYGLAVLLAWLGWAPLVLSRTGLGWLPITLPMPWTVLGLVGPPLAALIVQWRERRNLSIARLRAPLRRWLIGTAVAVVVLAATFVLGSATLLTRNPPQGWDTAALQFYGHHVILTFIGGPIFEEWGWRGFAQARLQRVIGPLRAALVVGVGWALWHAPLFLIPTWSSASLPLYVVMVTALSIVMAWGFNLAGGVVFTAIIMHAAYNASSRVLGGFLGTASLRSWPDGVTAILLAFVVLAVVLAVATRGRLAWRSDSAKASSEGEALA